VVDAVAEEVPAKAVARDAAVVEDAAGLEVLVRLQAAMPPRQLHHHHLLLRHRPRFKQRPQRRLNRTGSFISKLMPRTVQEPLFAMSSMGKSRISVWRTGISSVPGQ